MSSLTNIEYLKVFESFLKENFYVNLKYDNPEILVYYNTITNDILTGLTIDNKDFISQISEFSDYITFISDSNNRLNIQEEKIGLIYIDKNGKALKDSIMIAKPPVLQTINPIKRKEFTEKFSNINIINPFWHYTPRKNINYKDEIVTDSKQLEKGKLLIERSIEKYCSKNNIPRDNITNLDSFMDHLLPDIFKYKISVSEEQEIHKEIENFNKMYPEVFLKSLYKMGYLE